ncbi:MAG: ABC transporter substrate-binding protein [Gemmatimonadaceae bacterium]
MRVVSLLPAATEIVAALGALEMLVGVTHECDYPPQVASLPRVTRSAVDARGDAGTVDAQVRAAHQAGSALFSLDEARIAELRPDVILTQALCDVCAVSETDVRSLASRLAPRPRVVTLGATTLGGMFMDIALVAEPLDAADEAVELTMGLGARMRAVHERLEAAAAPRPRAVVVEWTEPLYVAGHWVPEMVRRAGGADVLARAGDHSRTISAAEVEGANPEVVIVAPCGHDVMRAAENGARLLARAEWAWARSRSVWAVDGNALVSRPGPRLVEGIATFAAMLHPALFPAPRPEYARRVAGS